MDTTVWALVGAGIAAVTALVGAVATWQSSVSQRRQIAKIEIEMQGTALQVLAQSAAMTSASGQFNWSASKLSELTNGLSRMPDSTVRIVVTNPLADHLRPRRRRPGRLVRTSAQGMTGLAALIAGRRRRPRLRDEWRSHLAGETGLGLPTGRRIHAALGFVAAAMRYRLQDAADLAWRPADRVLRSRRLSNLFVLVPTTGVAVFIFVHDGTLGVMLGMESISATGAVLYGLVRCGRWWRDVKPPSPRPRSKD